MEYQVKTIKNDGPPPYDCPVLCRGKHKEYNYWRYALAYNSTYPPNMMMVQILELDEESMDKLPILNPVPFDVEEWMVLEQ